MDWRLKTIFGFILFSIFFAFLLVPPIAQPLAYHNFVDSRGWQLIPNFGDVASNFGFLIFGIWGLWTVKNSPSQSGSKIAWWIFFFGVSLTAVGSGYYHWSPSNYTLVWDRLPMTISFMSLISIIVTEVIHKDWGRKLLIPLLVIGFSSVAYWHFTEQQGVGDLRPYALVQFVPLFIIPFILFSYPIKDSLKKGLWLLILFYVLAKFSEALDGHIFDYFFFSGHSLKHLLAAFGIYYMLQPARES